AGFLIHTAFHLLAVSLSDPVLLRGPGGRPFPGDLSARGPPACPQPAGMAARLFHQLRSEARTMRERQRMQRMRKPRFAEISVVPDEDECEIVIGPPDEGARPARAKRARPMDAR